MAARPCSLLLGGSGGLGCILHTVDHGVMLQGKALPHLEGGGCHSSWLSSALNYAVADIARREDTLNLIRNAVGTATPVGIPVCCRGTRKTEG